MYVLFQIYHEMWQELMAIFVQFWLRYSPLTQTVGQLAEDEGFQTIRHLAISIVNWVAMVCTTFDFTVWHNLQPIIFAFSS